MLNVRADVVESLIAAIYLDGGLEAARAFITALLGTARMRDDEGARDPKTELQEWAHQAAASRRSTGSTAAKVPTMIRSSRSASRSGARSPASGSEPLQACGRTGCGRRDLLIREGVWQDPWRMNG